jgi:hypothetical protein
LSLSNAGATGFGLRARRQSTVEPAARLPPSSGGLFLGGLPALALDLAAGGLPALVLHLAAVEA